ncbi:MAG: FAD-dependent oxidoreductase [Gammaproteobacteria bacterium]|nr:FAD-dependent oxidoreductase [Gammaproteobacteria bacterium]
MGEDPHIPYQRPPLSKQYLASEHGIERVYLRPEKFYAERNIAVRVGLRVETIDASARTLACSDGSTVAYDKLLLATGTRPRVLRAPGIELAGIHYLRTLGDVDAIKAEISPGKKLVIIGGGYIGLEVAAVAVQAGLAVTVLEMEDRILQRVTTPEMSTFYDNLHTSHGVTINTNTAAESFTGANGEGGAAGDAGVNTVVCTDGTNVPAEIVVIGIGVVPNVEVADAAGIDCDNGILVDEHCRTSDANIYAAGDCTNHPNPLLGRRLRLESVPNAMEQARVAASNMNGNDKNYASVPWFWSDQYDLKLQMVGFSADGNNQVVRGDTDAGQFAIFYFDDDVLVAADAVNSAKEFMVCRQLVGQKVDKRALGDPATDLKTLLAPR